MDAHLTQLRTLTLSANEAARVKLSSALTELQTIIDIPTITVMRISNSTLQMAALCASVDLGALKALAAASPASLSIVQLAETCNVPSHWLVPLLRVLAAGHLVRETGPGTFAANETTRALAQESNEAAVRFCYEGIIPTLTALPGYLKENGYKAPDEVPRTAFQQAMNTDLAPFAYLAARPERLRDFQLMMTNTRGLTDWLDAFPFEAETREWQGTEKPLFVDVGGGFGTQCQGLLHKQPQAKGKVILQDLKETLDKAPEINGVEKMVYDFFTPQPVTGARFYYLRLVLHDWPHDKAVEILRNVGLGMGSGSGSKLLIDETVISDKGVSWMTAMSDVMMRANFGVPERTADDWRRLLEDSGFKLEQVIPYSLTQGLSVIVAAPA